MYLFNFMNTQQTFLFLFYFDIIGSSLVSAKYNKKGKRKNDVFVVHFCVLRTD